MSIKRNTLWNLLGSVLPMLVGIAAIPYIYINIGIERIGILTIIWALIGYFSIFDFGLGRAITQRIASLTSPHTDIQKKTIATTGVFLTLLLGALASLIGFVCIELLGVSWLNSTPHLETEIRVSFMLACLAIPASTATAGFRGVLEGDQRFRDINLLKLILGLSNFLGPMASIALFGQRLDYIVGALVVARFLILFAHHRTARHDRFDRLIADDTGADCIDRDIYPARVDCQRRSHGIGRFCIYRMGSTPMFGHLEAGVRDIADNNLLDATCFGSGNHT